MSGLWAPHSWGELTMKETIATKEDMAKFENDDLIIFESLIQIVQGKDGKMYWRAI